MSVLLSNDELDALHGQIPELWQFYVVIKQVMDYRTGVAGNRVGISWRTLCERLHVEPGQGLQGTGTPTKAKVRRLADRAERVGLLVDKTQGKHLVFFLPLAKRDDSARKKPGTNPAQTRHTIPAHEETNSQADLLGDSDDNPAYSQSEELPKTRHDSVLRSPKDSDPIGSGASAGGGSPKTAIWNLGEIYLGSRALVGKLCKQYGEAPVFHAIAQTATHEPADPKAYIHGLLKANGGTHAKPGHNGSRYRSRAQRGEDYAAEVRAAIAANGGYTAMDG